MKILYTCFKGKNNSSFQVLQEITGEKVYLTNSFAGLERDIKVITGDYDMVVMLGLDTHIKDMVRVERVAEYEGVELRSRMDCSAVSRCFEESGIRCPVSEIPTRYLCNAAYYHMLHRFEGRAVFIHIPARKNMGEIMKERLVEVLREISMCG